MNEQAKTMIKSFADGMIDVLNGGLMGGLIGSAMGIGAVVSIWFVMGGPLVFQLSLQDVAYGTQVGLIEGAGLGLFLGMFDCLQRRRASQCTNN